MANILSINIPENIVKSQGLAEIKMDGIGSTVAIAGKNGAGKTRLLKTIKDYLEKPEELYRNPSPWPNLDEINAEIANLTAALKTAQENNSTDTTLIYSLRQTLDSAISKLRQAQSAILDTNKRPVFIEFFPKACNFTDPSQAHQQALKATYKNLKSGPNRLDPSISETLIYIQYVYNQWIRTRHPDSIESIPQLEIERAVKEYDYLNKLIFDLLGVYLQKLVSLDSDGFTLFDRPSDALNLSSGQSILLQIAIKLHAVQENLDDVIFLIDEPENHLHPEAVIFVIDKLRLAAPESQMWIATHSVPLLAHLASVDSRCLWFMSEKKIKRSGKQPKDVLESLLGSTDEVARLLSFVGLADEFAAAQFTLQCLYEPTVVANGILDPQTIQIRSILRHKFEKAALIIDFGAGKGRLLQSFKDTHNERPIQDTLDYIAYEPFASDDTCEKTIASIYGNNSNRFFSKPHHLLAAYPDKNIDVAILCNVLHEIPPDKWISTFNGNSLIENSLAENGYVLIVEDQKIPVGEVAHEFGFIVLDEFPIMRLFGVTTTDRNNGLFVANSDRNGRLTAFLVHKSLISRISQQSLTNAIAATAEIAASNIMRIRSGPDRKFETGQELGFWLQQYANSSMFMAQIGK